MTSSLTPSLGALMAPLNPASPSSPAATGHIGGPATGGDRQGGRPSAFARLLSQRPAVATPSGKAVTAPPTAPQPQPARPPSAGSTEARQAAERSSEQQRAERQREARAAQSAKGASPRTVPTSDEASAVVSDAADAATDKFTDEHLLDPAVAHWLAGQQSAEPQASGMALASMAASAGAGSGDAVKGDDGTPASMAAQVETSGGLVDGKLSTQSRQHALLARRQQGDTADNAAQAGSKDAAPESGLALATDPQAIADSQARLWDVVAPTHDTASSRDGIDAGQPSFGIDAATSAIGNTGSTSSAGATGARLAANPMPVNVPVTAPATAPEFRAALGIQVSRLAKDGVQHAQLHLNPADMGPISVRIALDGQQARVDFGADSAITRQIIEAGLPELASALREAGLTLSGGGVSQQARGRDPDSHDGSARAGQRPDSAPDASAVTATDALAGRPLRRSLPGGVDVYA